jgi:hypothetical protein
MHSKAAGAGVTVGERVDVGRRVRVRVPTRVGDVHVADRETLPLRVR